MFPPKVALRLNSKNQYLEGAMSSKDFGALSQQDYALAMALVKLPGARLLGRVKYAEQNEFYKGLVREVFFHIKPTAHKRRWKLTRAELYRLCETAVYEHIHPRKCRKCRGRGWRPKGKLHVHCERCDGYGVVSRSQQSRSKRARIGWWRWHSYVNTWYCKDVLSVLDHYETQFFTDIYRILRLDKTN